MFSGKLCKFSGFVWDTPAERRVPRVCSIERNVPFWPKMAHFWQIYTKFGRNNHILARKSPQFGRVWPCLAVSVLVFPCPCGCSRVLVGPLWCGPLFGVVPLWCGVSSLVCPSLVCPSLVWSPFGVCPLFGGVVSPLVGQAPALVGQASSSGGQASSQWWDRPPPSGGNLPCGGKPPSGGKPSQW